MKMPVCREVSCAVEKLGLVLAGGGGKGAYEIGVWQALRDLGFRARLASEQDVKRLLAVYYQQDVTTEWFETCDGERWVTENA